MLSFIWAWLCWRMQRAQRDYWPLALLTWLVIVISASIHSYCLRRGRTLDRFSLVCERDLLKPSSPLPKQPACVAHIMFLSCDGGRNWSWMIYSANSPLLARTSFLSSTTQMCMFSPSWPHHITSTNFSNNLTRNDAQTPENQQLLEPPLPFLFVLIPLPSASLCPPPFFTAKL